MTSTTVYLTEDQQSRLGAVADRLRVPKAVLIREGIDLAITARGGPLLAGVRGGAALQCDCDACLNGDPHVEHG
jgi:predicted transcriptional regulator